MLNITNELASTIALTALKELAADEESLIGFLRQTGIGPQDLRLRINDPALLGAALAFFVADQDRALAFCEHSGYTADDLNRALAALGNGQPEDMA